MRELFGLNIDYDGKNGNHLLISRKGGLMSQNFEDIEVNMLLSNKIPGLLPLSLEELDLQVTLRYNLNNKRMLKTFVQSQKLTMKNYYTILYRIAEILNESKNYMLAENKYLIDKEFIFLGDDMLDLSLTYLPIKTIPEKKQVTEELKLLASELAVDVKGLQGEKYQELIQYFNHDDFSLVGLKKKLKEFLNQLNFAAVPEHTNQSKVPIVETQVIAGQGKVANAAEKTVKASDKKTGLTSLPQELPERSRLIIILGAILLSAALWQSYLGSPSKGLLYINIGLTIAIADIAFILIKIWYPHKYAKSVANIPESVEQFVAVAGLQKPAIDISTYYDDLHDMTAFLDEGDDATGLLTQENEQPHPNKRVRAFFVYNKNGSSTKTEIKKGSMTIGRKESAVDFALDIVGVSRLHCEIVSASDKYMVKDLSSKNGTLLNNEKIVPYKTYPLQNGDELIIGKSTLTFIVQ
jgi:TM2 domain-containing membrane protein YozV